MLENRNRIIFFQFCNPYSLPIVTMTIANNTNKSVHPLGKVQLLLCNISTIISAYS